MIIYHGSNMIIKEPKVIKSNRALDFGMGFYATTFKEQAEKWAIRTSDYGMFKVYWNGGSKII